MVPRHLLFVSFCTRFASPGLSRPGRSAVLQPLRRAAAAGPSFGGSAGCAAKRPTGAPVAQRRLGNLSGCNAKNESDTCNELRSVQDRSRMA